MGKLDKLQENKNKLAAGQQPLHNPAWERLEKELDKYRMHVDTQLPELKHLLNINGINCFPRGDLVAISGKEKCGKTTDCRIIVSALLKGEYMGVKAIENKEDENNNQDTEKSNMSEANNKIRILWIDTEQANQTSRTVMRGIKLMCGFVPTDEQLLYIALREYPDRKQMIEAMRVLFDTFRPDIAIIDGIRDFISDFNDVVESAEIVLECMQLSSGVSAEKARLTTLAERPPCCVCCILHQNKPKDDNNMRGHLGTELSNKAGEVWEATQDESHIFTFKQIRSRTRPVDDPLYYQVESGFYHDIQTDKVEEIGIPKLCTIEKNDDKLPAPVETFMTNLGPLPLTQDTAYRLFYAAMGFAEWDYKVVKSEFANRWGIDYVMFEKLRALTDYHFHEKFIEVADSKHPGKTNYIKKWIYDGPKF